MPVDTGASIPNTVNPPEMTAPGKRVVRLASVIGTDTLLHAPEQAATLHVPVAPGTNCGTKTINWPTVFMTCQPPQSHVAPSLDSKYVTFCGTCAPPMMGTKLTFMLCKRVAASLAAMK